MCDRKKILIYGLSIVWGGVESIIFSIISELKDSCEFTLLLSKGECSYNTKLLGSQIKVIQITSWGESRSQFRTELKTIYQNNNFDFLWINASIMSNFDIILTTKKYSKAKIITHSHGSSFEEKNFFKSKVLLLLHYIYRQRYIKYSDYHWACSLLSAKWFYGHCLDKINLHIVKNGINVAKYRFNEETRLKYRAVFNCKEKLVFFHAGRLSEVKNQRFIISIFAEIVKSIDNAILIIAGDGHLKEQLKEYSISLNLDEHIKFIGNRNDIPELFMTSDAFLLPSFHEGLPVTLIEAQATGINCFVSDRVSKEASITSNVKYLPLEIGAKCWAKQILDNINNLKREATEHKVNMAGYNIKTVAKNISDILKL